MKRYIIPILMAVSLLVVMAVPCFAASGYAGPNVLKYGATYNMYISQTAFTPNSADGYYRYIDTSPTSPGTWESDIYDYEQGSSVGYGYVTMKANPDFDSDGFRLVVTIDQASYHPKSDLASLPTIVLDVDQTHAPVNVRYTWSAYSADGRLLDDGVVDFSTREIYGYDIYKSIDTDVDADFINFSSVSITADIYDDHDFESISFQVPFYTGLVANAPLYGPVPVVRTVSDVSDVGDFLFNSVRGFLRFEVMPSVTIGALFLALCGLAVTMWILKLVAGG